MSSSKVIYVNDDDMLGGMFNNETKPLVSAPEHKPTNTPMTTSQQVSVEQTDGGQQSIPVQETHIQPVIAQEASMVPQQPPVIQQQPPVIQQQQPSMVQENQPVITNSHQLPVMTGGGKNGDGSSKSSSDSGSDDDDSKETPDGNDIDIDIDSASDTSSICTEQLLTFDPMYIKLTKFLYTSKPGTNTGRNITQVLEGIEKQMERLATALENSTLMSASSVEETNSDE